MSIYPAIDNLTTVHVRYCNISSGCNTILEDHQAKCIYCIHRERIRDRKRENKKRQDPNLCLDCGVIFSKEIYRAKGQHDKQLRRCVPCYEIFQLHESQKIKKEKMNIVKPFTNKHVIWNYYVKNAKKDNINFTLSKTLFNQLILQKCNYCGYSKNGELNGIYCLDNNKGYIEENIIPCCLNCSMKTKKAPNEL